MAHSNKIKKQCPLKNNVLIVNFSLIDFIEITKNLQNFVGNVIEKE